VPSKTAPKKSSTQIEILTTPGLRRLGWLVHGFSTRTGGSSKVYGGGALNLGFTKEDTQKAVERNRKEFLKTLGTPDWPLATVRQIHSDIIHCVDGAHEETTRPSQNQARVGHPLHDGEPPAGDGIMTNVPGVLLSIRTADCMPVILVDVKQRAVAAVHAGWRGTLSRIAEKGVGEMRRRFGSRPEDIRAALGPSIRGCCYEVGEEVRDQFQAQFAYTAELFEEHRAHSRIVHLKYPLLFLTQRAPGHSDLPKTILLDLEKANRRQLIDAGIGERNISSVALCTSCRNDLLFSHRKEKGVTGRMMAVVGIRG
jgi:polyphenol oxidase